MRVAYVSSYYRPAYIYGGPVNAAAALCEGMANEGANVTVLTTNANGGMTLNVPLRQRVDLEGVSVLYFPLVLGGLSYFYCPSLAEAITSRILDFDLVIVAAIWGHALRPTALACLRHRVPYVISVDGQLYPWALSKKRLKKTLYMKVIARRYIKCAAGIRCTDPTEAKAVDRLEFESPTFVVPHPVRLSDFSSERGSVSWRQKMSIPTDSAILLFLGRLTNIKRPDIAVEILGAAQELPRDIHLIMAGPDEDRLMKELQEQAHSLGCASKLHFTGLLNREAIASLLAEADLLVMPSEVQENFGMAALEAMVAGVPILVSTGIPVGVWAQNEGAGQVVACTKDAFRIAALKLLSQPERLRTMGQLGKDLARRHFDSAVVAREMLTQCEAIIATGRPL